MKFITPIETPDGTFTASFSERGLAGLEFPSGRRQRADAGNVDLPAQVRQWRALTARAVQAVLAGRKPASLPPLDLSGGTEFQRSVWEEIRSIVLGKTKTYGQIAAAIRRPRAMRAVGGACGANPIPLLVPCHRVLASGGGLGGFSGGLKWKPLLLAREGVKSVSAR